MVYVLAVTWIVVGGLLGAFLSYKISGPVAAVAALLIVVGQAWLFSLIFKGNPGAALVVLLVPIVGLCLAIQFIVDQWSVARWPALCQIAGLVLWFGGLFSR